MLLGVPCLCCVLFVHLASHVHTNQTVTITEQCCYVTAYRCGHLARGNQQCNCCLFSFVCSCPLPCSAALVSAEVRLGSSGSPGASTRAAAALWCRSDTYEAGPKLQILVMLRVSHGVFDSRPYDRSYSFDFVAGRGPLRLMPLRTVAVSVLVDGRILLELTLQDVQLRKLRQIHTHITR